MSENAVVLFAPIDQQALVDLRLVEAGVRNIPGVRIYEEPIVSARVTR